MTVDGDKKKKCLIAGSVSGLLVIMVVSVAVVTSKHTPNENQIRTTTKAVRAVCAPTDFKEACVKSLMDASPNSTEPLELIKLSFNATIKSINDNLKKASEDVKPEADKDPGAKGAFQLCERLMIDAIDDLKKCVDREFSVTQVELYVEDLRVWLSGSIAFQQTCMDTFDETKSNLMRDMLNIFKTSRELSSNSLAMTTDLPKILPNSNITGLTGALAKYARKLLYTEDAIPTWVGPHARRLMAGEPKGGGPPPVRANVAVAQDGSGHFKTIADALKVVPRNNRMPFIIHIKEGIYKERVKVTKKMAYVTFVGDGPNKTKITGSLNFGIGKVKTFLTSTLTIEGEHFTAKNIGIENTAGPEGGQAVALRVSADYAVFYSCQIDGYQDTLYVHSQRQFYRDCTVSGTVDFIFGDAKCILQNCKIVVRKPKGGQSCMVTAQGRSDVRESTGLVLHHCHIMGEPAYIPVKSENKAYLGRPWKEFSRTIIMETMIDDVIDPAGWLPWNGDFALKTLYYAEHLNAGPGSNQTLRVNWPGVKILSPEEALLYTGGRFLVGDSWIPQTQVPYTANM
ncbi:putative pectinesterase/pectinesterase inhibitor 23 [Raphanus sativus]|uniref:Pectinesterase n=1 Tax=Raphanus sativus TaxID=3726 RepID=A0A6J0P189_RAPSA|nr:probable pectinesterase/pectinesterase inhibitor 23 [Raphanus sativus]KAJ4893056.1 putative pectinesterase/pectinesterase inhibitor 23 [Raphanus sativus]